MGRGRVPSVRVKWWQSNNVVKDGGSLDLCSVLSRMCAVVGLGAGDVCEVGCGVPLRGCGGVKSDV